MADEFFNFNIFANADWSPFEKFMSDPHNFEREMAALDAGLAASPLLRMSQDDQIQFFNNLFEGDPATVDLDKRWAQEVKDAQDKARETYNTLNNITPKEDTTKKEDPKFVRHGYRGECGNRVRFEVWSDGSQRNQVADPEDCGRPSFPKADTTAVISNPPAPVTPTPPAPTPPPPPPPPAKTAPIDTILYPSDDQLPLEIMADLIFEDIGGQELINIARTDTVNGQSVIYQPIKNLTQIQQEYNPINIVSLQDTSNKYFQNFSIKLETKVPTDGNGPDGEHVYIDSETGDLVVEAINMAGDEQIEVQITTSGTIYEVEL